MSTLNFPEWPLAQNLGYRIVEQLAGYSKVIQDRVAKCIRIEGNLALGNSEFATRKNARCTFEVAPNWILQIPSVKCLEPWVIRKLPEWHIGVDGQLCFEFDSYWEQELRPMAEQLTYGLTADFACAWLLNSTRSLLQRHLFASRVKLAVWPKNWEYWAHTRNAANHQLMAQLRRQSHASPF